MSDFNYDELIKKLINKEPFTFTRFGDGEMLAIWQDPKRTVNCDGHTYFPDMGIALNNVLKSNPKYHVGLQNMVRNLHPEKLEQYFLENNIDIDFCEADMLHRASIRGNIKPFFDALNSVDNLILAAPNYMMEIKKYVQFKFYANVPNENCWTAKNLIKKDTRILINDLLEKGEKNIVVIMAASMPSNVIIHELHDIFGDRITLIDIGSVFDPFVGNNIRSYHKNMDLFEKNGIKK